MKFILNALALAALIVLAGCDRAPSNVKTLLTKDCGVTWEVVPPGARIPNTVGSCEYKTVLPDYPMQGEADFQSQFRGNVLVRIKISYDYEITDGLKFLEQAKFLAKSGSAASSAEGTKMSTFETAENVVIDVRIRELVTSQTLKFDIVDFNPSSFEDTLFENVNKVLSTRGVRLNSITFVTIPDEQTRAAIDAATAVNVYKAKGLLDFGKQLAIAKAGATQINIGQ